jgi:hypothetical protein
LDQALETWKGVVFGALYLDFCTGSSDVIRANITALLPHMETDCVLGFTFTRRDGSGETAVKRQYKIEALLREHGFLRCMHDGLIDFAPSGVYTQFYARRRHHV